MNFSTDNGYTELQDSTANQNRPYQSLTNSNNTRSPKFHQYEEVKDDKGTLYSPLASYVAITHNYNNVNLLTVTFAAEGNYSEPYNLKNKKLLPHHQYDVVTGTINFYNLYTYYLRAMSVCISGDANPLPKRSFVR